MVPSLSGTVGSAGTRASGGAVTGRANNWSPQKAEQPATSIQTRGVNHRVIMRDYDGQLASVPNHCLSAFFFVHLP
ncbi:hypothetical protein VITFI_CDS3168 [Vitreoscilla filiformis]|uniref:Uncharacterized protein n=1 Tax=Vitreoscilla filiformis TaxID=63 RepID=A0A221KJ03_VITFI|nr:hypothetical protein VITFI_CDS3168 [Vitreoscilla filiformis]